MKVLIPKSGKSLPKPCLRKKGQTLVEYTLILAVITFIAVGVFALMGARIEMIFSKVSLILDSAQASGS